MNVKIFIIKIGCILLCIHMAGCASMKYDGLPTGLTIDCSDGERLVVDCSKAFNQFATTLRFDVGIVQSSAVGVGLGAQKLISLDTITGDLLAHQRQICIDYNNCLLTKEEYKEEMRYLRRAQLEIRKAAYWSQGGAGSMQYEGPPALPGVAMEDGQYSDYDQYADQQSNGEEYYYSENSGGTEPYEGDPSIPESQNMDESQYAVLNELNEVSDGIKGLTSDSGTVNERAISDAKTKEGPKPVGIEYSIAVRRKKTPETSGVKGKFEYFDFVPNMSLMSGDQFKINFKTNADGYVYIVNFDSSGVPQVIFPHSNIEMDNKVTADIHYRLPPEGYYELDNVTGDESFYFIASPFNIPHVDNLVLGSRKDESSDNSSEKSRVQIARTRGVLDVLTRGISQIVTDAEEEISTGEAPGTLGPETGGENISEKFGVTSVRVDFYHE